MILEQLVTAGTTTSRCLKKLIKRYGSLSAFQPLLDEERAVPPVGTLKIDYYTPKSAQQRESGEPMQSHLKLTIVDSEWVVLGSGNMDRASWYTSQEVGIAFRSQDLAREIKRTVDGQLDGRKRTIFNSRL